MASLNEPCGCSLGDNEYQSVINQSPILSGEQEAAFSPGNNSFSFLESNDSMSNNHDGLLNNYDSVKNSFSENNESKKNYSLDDIIDISNKKSNNNIKEMNFQSESMSQINNQLNNQPNINQMMNNSNPMNNNPNINVRNSNALPDSGMMRNTPQNVNPELQNLMNNLNIKANNANANSHNETEGAETATRFILKNFNIVLVVVIALAWSDVAKFYINRSIKFGGGNHKYYIYYALLVTVVLYGTSKYIHTLN